MKVKCLNIPTAPLILFVLSIIFLALGLYNAYHVFLTRSWPTVMGQIIKSEIESKELSDIDTLYYLSLRYCYVVEGKDYTASRISYGDRISDNEESDKVNKLTGATIKV